MSWVAECKRCFPRRPEGPAAPPEPVPPDVPTPLVEPRTHDWDDDPRTSARADARYWDELYDRDEEN
ncbi:hypothetical protein ACFVT5_41210 [Streptomyces sp. NPDC058001]|uniref:hypothetical protein n=1 Tax=Streptomyces sp. NPDC058001 TaxID=3346300 RepID=UPI0036ECB06F